MAAIDVLKAQLVRSSVNEDWGIRLQGGADTGGALCIHRVTPGSPAHRIGLNNNDQITYIEDTPTKYLNHNDAVTMMHRMGDSMVLTVERTSWGRPPTQPVIRSTAKPQPKFYQTLNMTGAQPQPDPANVEFRIAKPKLFEEPVRPPHTPPAPPSVPVQPDLRAPPRTRERAPQFSPPPPNVYRAGPVKYVPEEDKLADDTSQSRTFKILRSLMENEEPYSGVDGLPPPRSAEMERMKEDFAKQNPKARVKVFMPQQYNSPMGMYSPENVMESFQTQAEGYFDDLDRKETQASEQTISNTAKAVLEQEGNASSDF